MDSISERLVLFALDNKHQTLIEKLDLRLGYGLSGALLLDLLDKGSIAYTDEGMLQAQMHDAPSAGYLQKALELLPRHAPSSHEGLSRTLYANMPMLKPLVLDALEQKGVLKSDEAKLKWSFAMKAYHVVDAHAGYREQLLAALLEDRLSIRDFWVLQFARSTELLWGGGQEKAEVLAAMERLEQLAGMVTHGRTLAQQMVEELPDAIAQAHRLGKMKGKRRYDEVWEWRGFWTEKGQTLIQASDMYQKSLEDFTFSEHKDAYLVVAGVPENIKLREGALEIKRPAAREEGYVSYKPKEVFAFPFKAKKLKKVFPAFKSLEKDTVKSTKSLLKLLEAQHYEAKVVEVQKKRFQVKLKSQVKVEFCTLVVAGQKYLSACVEGPDYDLTHAHSHNFHTEGVQVMGYVEFLKHCVMEGATA